MSHSVMKSLLTLLFSSLTIGAMAAPTVVRPVKSGQPTSFAIITDNATYDATRQAMTRYRDAVEADGLSTYIIYDNWGSPDDVRGALKSLYASDPMLEGVVFVGDVPVAMVRNAQHMTTAFKMNEDTFPFIESSVPSDRFYDCLDLTFRFLKQDEEKSHLYYYELEESCPQTLNPTFYSARIRYPEKRGGDKYQATANFLNKAAMAKSARIADKLDDVVSFNGHGYNSDCLIAWMDEEKAYRENFPLAFSTATSFKHWNYRMLHPMKYRLYEELERPGIDLFMFHEHGAPTTQYINGSVLGTSDRTRIDRIKISLYSRAKRAIAKGNPEDEVIAAFTQEYNLLPDFFADFNNDEYWKADSIADADINIDAEEFHNRTTQPKVVMFDACYNGSFHEEDYIAGEYLFNDGATLAAQGNTRNVLQDRWTIEMIGLLSHGVRVGHYNRIVATLEGHLMGDPTMHFSPIELNTLSSDITTRKADKEYWKSQLSSKYADVQALALRMLADADTDNSLSPLLFEVYSTSPLNTVRMEAVKLLTRYNNADMVSAIKLGVNDPYERIARWCANLAGDNGSPELLPTLVKTLIEDGERERVNYVLGNSLMLFDPKLVENAVNDYYAKSNRYNAEAEKSDLLASLKKRRSYIEETNSEIADTTLSAKERISSIRYVRNNPSHPDLDLYLSVVADENNPDEVRVIMAEALGWFDNSIRRDEIINFCNAQLKKENNPAALTAEITQTLNRMK